MLPTGLRFGHLMPALPQFPHLCASRGEQQSKLSPQDPGLRGTAVSASLSAPILPERIPGRKPGKSLPPGRERLGDQGVRGEAVTAVRDRHTPGSGTPPHRSMYTSHKCTRVHTHAHSLPPSLWVDPRGLGAACRVVPVCTLQPPSAAQHGALLAPVGRGSGNRPGFCTSDRTTLPQGPLWPPDHPAVCE